jgi:predicted acylesterase/phospholipase RssA
MEPAVDENQSTDTPPRPPKKIRHIVLSGGGGIGHSFYGAIRNANKDGFWNIEDIQTMHGTSIGAIFMVFASTVQHIGWDSYDDFFIKRPWESVLDFTVERVFNSYSNTGMFNQSHIENVFSPVMKALDLPLNITLHEFYEFTKISTHFYATDLKRYELVNISHKTHPEWKLLDAVYCSCALPILFEPCKIGDRYYADGGIFCNYPIAQCVEIAEDPDEILGFKKLGPKNASDVETYNNLGDYLFDILDKTMRTISKKEIDIKHCIWFEDEFASAAQVYNALKTRESRESKVKFGVEMWDAFKTSIGFVPTTTTTTHPLNTP